jgi:hypothetical protein
MVSVIEIKPIPAGGKSSSQVLIGILPIVLIAGLSVILLGWQKSIRAA